MALARFKKICLDAADPDVLGRFWAGALELTWVSDGGEGGVYGADRQPVLWINRVPQPKAVKHRVHLDIYAAAVTDLQALGASVLVREGDDRRWTVMADPEGGEFCAFLREVPATPRLHGLVVDCADPAAQARFWVDVLGGAVVDHLQGYSTAMDVPGMGFTFDFVPVPELKEGANRIHLDVAAPVLQPILDAGARVLREPDDEIEWHVLADPEGNEFCVFDRADALAG
ncbi:MAG: VOC family protein [Jatrophihabitantaceae bacterium]